MLKEQQGFPYLRYSDIRVLAILLAKAWSIRQRMQSITKVVTVAGHSVEEELQHLIFVPPLRLLLLLLLLLSSIAPATAFKSWSASLTLYPSSLLPLQRRVVLS